MNDDLKARAMQYLEQEFRTLTAERDNQYDQAVEATGKMLRAEADLQRLRAGVQAIADGLYGAAGSSEVGGLSAYGCRTLANELLALLKEAP